MNYLFLMLDNLRVSLTSKIETVLNHNLRLCLLFFCIFVVCVRLVPDYGISWDEPAQRDLGQLNYSYITTGNTQLIYSGDRYYGAWYEVLLIAGEKLFQLSDTRNIYFFRHTVNFITFYLGCLMFFCLVQNIWRNKYLSFLGFILLLTSPRHFADGFYNSKDIPFMVLYLSANYSLLLLMQKRSYLRLSVHAILTGLCLSLRLAGIFAVGITLLWQLSNLLLHNSKSSHEAVRTLREIALFILIVAATLYVSWPILWIDPHNLMMALDQMKNYPWPGTTLFLGKFIFASAVPWYYIPVWMGVTTPLLVLASMVGGIWIFIIKHMRLLISYIGKKKLKTSKESLIYKKLWLIGALIMAPYLSAVLLKSTLYDGWRHFFFTYPLLIIFAIFCVQRLWQFKPQRNRMLIRLSLLTLIIANLSTSTFFLIQNHPHQNIYFNILAGNDYQQIKQRFEMDYWGLSSREVLENLLQNMTGHITIATESVPVQFNYQILTSEQQQRISFVDTTQISAADVFIGSYRYHPEPYPCSELLFSSQIGGAALSSAYSAESCHFATQ